MFETRNSYLAVDNWCYWGLWGRYAGNTIITLKQKLNIWGHATFMPFFSGMHEQFTNETHWTDINLRMLTIGLED